MGTSVLAQSNTIPIFQFAVFYNSLLEFTWSPPMTVNGRVHANGDIYTGSAWQLTFNDYVSTTGTVSSPAWAGHATGSYSVPTIYNRPCVTNASPLTLPGVSNTPDALREIINMPPLGEDPNSPLGLQRYFNKAKIVLLVSNTTITAVFKTSATDPAPALVTATYYPTNNNPSNYISITTNFPYLSITNYWPSNPVPVVDQREYDTLKLTDVDVGVLRRWIVTNAILNTKFPNSGGVYPSATDAPNILYVANNRTSSTNQLPAVRLRNSQIIPTNLFVFNGSNTPSGFTLATPNPLYIYGHYNCPDNTKLGTTNTSSAYPASLICDALTLLSGNWRDDQSGYFLPSGSKNVPTSTTINAAILTGIVYSTGPGDSTFSGGLHNQPRLLENWNTSLTLTLNSSFVNLFASARATNQHQNPGVYYNAPTRQFSFNSGFLFPWKLPPGTPVVGPTTPFISSPPQNTNIVIGNSATFSVTATGQSPLSYQWQFAGANIPSATDSTYTVTGATSGNAGVYSVIVGNTFGSQTNFYTLGVNSPPQISQPPCDQAAMAGEDARFQVTALGTAPLNFQWLFNGAPIAGATDASLLLTGVQTNSAGAYSVIVSNIAGSITSAPASLYILSAPDFRWARSVTNSGASIGMSGALGLALDPAGNLFAAGGFTKATVDFGGVVLTNPTAPLLRSANFLCKYDSSGNLLWAQLAGTNGYSSWMPRVSSDTAGNAYLAGQFAGTVTFGTNTLASSGQPHLFIAKFDPQGQTLWARQIAAFDTNIFIHYFGFAVAVDGSAFLAAPYNGSADFGSTVLTNGPGFLAKFDNDGNLAWARDTFGANALTFGTNGAVYMTGASNVLAKYDNLGTPVWSRPFPSGWRSRLTHRKTFTRPGTARELMTVFTLTNSGDYPDAFVAKCDSNGHVLWVRQLGEPNPSEARTSRSTNTTTSILRAPRRF